MKNITIIGKTTQVIKLQDDDSDNIEIYTKKLSNIFESKNVLIIHTSSGSVILRPSDIFAIEVTNDPESKPITTEETKILEQKEPTEDTITD